MLSTDSSKMSGTDEVNDSEDSTYDSASSSTTPEKEAENDK